ncbi:hypothetical protein [Rhizobium tropici]|uniref:hypothetical protein n=1 Tax=Rhizobium tropici TaxID=398 RepID=UPI001FEFC429|nr:hypothetical protein [Rhizobium tropici]
MPKRPLIQKGVAELEKLFDQQRDDPKFLEGLLEELSERKTQRAQELRQRAMQARGTIAQRSASRVDTNEPAMESPIVAAATPVGRPASPLPRPASVSAVPIRPTLERPSVGNDPESILSAWTAMEVLSPPSFRKPEDLASGVRYRIAQIDKDALPWENGGEKSLPNQKLYYQIILGSIDMEAAVSALLAVLATIMVDRDGRPVESQAVSISSFGWGIWPPDSPFAAGAQRAAPLWQPIDQRACCSRHRQATSGPKKSLRQLRKSDDALRPASYRRP